MKTIPQLQVALDYISLPPALVMAALVAPEVDIIEIGTPEAHAPGMGIHEMGTARMGKDPKTSVLNQWNACHDVPNLFVTDGSFMTSSGCQNPSLTFMAFTARAVDYCVKEMKRGNINR